MLSSTELLFTYYITNCNIERVDDWGAATIASCQVCSAEFETKLHDSVHVTITESLIRTYDV